MKITVFTSNQPRHLALIESLAEVADVIYAVQECNTVFPGQVNDFFKKSEVMQKYFQHVLAAEKEVFGKVRFLPENVRQVAIKSGDLNKLETSILAPSLQSDCYVVFGSSFIKEPLIGFLVGKKAYNIHMGVSPKYRGNSCNFWALYDGRPEYVGATIHLLTQGLDSGPILFHALPKSESVDGFVLGMKAVQAAHTGLIKFIQNGFKTEFSPVTQDKSLELRYTRNTDFTDQIASEYLLSKLHSAADIKSALEKRDMNEFIRPFLG